LEFTSLLDIIKKNLVLKKEQEENFQKRKDSFENLIKNNEYFSLKDASSFYRERFPKEILFSITEEVMKEFFIPSAVKKTLDYNPFV
jgi:hypothetical protein